MTTEPSRTPDKISTPILVALVSMGALLAAFAAFFVTQQLIDREPSRADLCTEAMNEIVALKAEYPDASVLDTDRSASLRLQNSGQKLQDNCYYREGVDFEQAEVYTWLPVLPDPTVPATAPSETAGE